MLGKKYIMAAHHAKDVDNFSTPPVTGEMLTTTVPTMKKQNKGLEETTKLYY